MKKLSFFLTLILLASLAPAQIYDPVTWNFRYEIVDPGTYNCIAHTAGIKNVWVNPYQKGDAWDLYYGPLGYAKATGTDTGHEKGVQKVAVYAARLPNGKLKEYTHAAVREADGTWTSKLGSGPLIRHRTAAAVGGGTYGEVVRVYARPR